MALANTMTTASGLVIKDAYTRVENITFLSKVSASFYAMTFNISPETNPVPAMVERYVVDVDPNLPVHNQLYKYLVTLGQFAGAKNC